MGSQGTGRRRIPNRERLTAEDDALNQIAREAEARLAAKRAARAEAREIRMKELERQQKEIYQVQKKYYGLDNKWGDIEQWMEDSEKYSRHSRRNTSISDDEERMSVGSRGSLRSDLDPVGAYGGASAGGSTHSHKKSKKKKKKHSKASNGYEDGYSIMSSRSSRLSDESKVSRPSRLDLHLGNYCSSDLYSSTSLPTSRLQSATQNGSRPSLLYSDAPHPRSHRGSVYEDSLYSGARRFSGSSSRAPSEYSGFLGSNSRASSRASSARASPVEDSSSVTSFLRNAASGSGILRDLDDITIPDLPDVEERSDRDFLEKGSRTASTLSAATLASLGGTSSRRGSGDTSLSVDTEASIREIKEIHELKDQIQDVEAKYMQTLKEVKDSLVEVEEKYRKAMVSNAQLDNEKSNLMYQVDTLKDSLMELEEQLSETRRQYEEKAKEFERERHAHSVLQFQFNEIKETLKQSEELLNEIRQLRLKQDSFVREISDLQETLEWKDKKIGALERQKEYSDAIRNERDELRDEVVQLKDVLKKHGIVLGADLTTNGEAGEGVIDGLANADSAPRLAQDAPASHAGSDSMLGKVNDELLGSRDMKEMGIGGILEKAESPAVQPQRQQGETETLDECDGEIMQEQLYKDNLSSLDPSHTQVSNTENLEEAQSDTPIASNEVTQGDSECSNNIELNSCPQNDAESEPSVFCHAQVEVVITGPEDEVRNDEDNFENDTEDNGEEGQEKSGEGMASEGIVDVKNVAEHECTDGAEESGKEGVGSKEVCQDGAVRENDSMAQQNHGEEFKDANESQGAKAEAHDHRDSKTKEGEEENSGCTAEKDPENPEAVALRVEQEEGPVTVDSKEKDDAQVGDPMRTAVPQPQTGPHSTPKELPSQASAKPPQANQGGSSGKKKKKKKKSKHKQKGGAQGDGSKAKDHLAEAEEEEEDAKVQEKSANDNAASMMGMQELAEEFKVSPGEPPAGEAEKPEPDIPAQTPEDVIIEREDKTEIDEGVQIKTKDIQTPERTEEVQTPETTEEIQTPESAEEVQASEETEEVQTPETTEEVQASKKVEEVQASEETEEVQTPETNKEVLTSEKMEEVQAPEETEEVQIPETNKEVLTSEKMEEVQTLKTTEEIQPLDTAEDVQTKKDCLESTNTEGLEKEERLLSECGPLVETQNSRDTEVEPKETPSPATQQAGSENTRDLNGESTHNIEAENTRNLEAENARNLQAEQACDIKLEAESDHATANSAATVSVGSIQASKESKEGNPQETGSTQEVSDDAPTEALEIEDFDSCEEADSTVQEEPTDPAEEAREDQLFTDSSERQEQEELAEYAIESSVAHSEDLGGENQVVSEEGSHSGEELSDSVGEPEVDLQDQVAQNGESSDQQQGEGRGSCEAREDAARENPDDADTPLKEEEEEDDDEGLSFDFDEDLDASESTPSVPHPEDGEADAPTAGESPEETEDGKPDLHAEAGQEEPQENTDSPSYKAEETESEVDGEEPGLVLSAQSQPGQSSFEEGEEAIAFVAPPDSQASQRGRKDSSKSKIRLRKLVDERETLVEQVRKLKAQLEQKQKNGTEESASPEGDVLENGTDPHILDVQRDANRQISDLKFKLVKSEQEVTALEQNVIRLEGQVTRYKSASENAEKVEDELKAEKRKMQRELRAALDKIDELEASNSHLTKRLEKMKANRSALLSQQ
ncbi:hypothetical protein MATL_G00153630 [Megalops atlanticus]|uniref:Leucine-rich repeat flightless-interacting protein 1 n=1 Tax=Megalops atlanticus TaxID=7932 RepID=A0A9D3T906_MEGAT|nr:hypothetical protein MATL_G00153630 [Megalops atlanticus]